MPRETSSGMFAALQQHIAREVDPCGEPIGAAAVRVGAAHQAMMGGADFRLACAGAEAKDLISLVPRHAAGGTAGGRLLVVGVSTIGTAGLRAIWPAAQACAVGSP